MIGTVLIRLRDKATTEKLAEAPAATVAATGWVTILGASTTGWRGQGRPARWVQGFGLDGPG